MWNMKQQCNHMIQCVDLLVVFKVLISLFKWFLKLLLLQQFVDFKYKQSLLSVNFKMYPCLIII